MKLIKTKHQYQLNLNKGKQIKKPVLASFGNNRSIELHITKDGILISVWTTANKRAHDILNGQDDLFADAVRKALLIYVIRYSCFLDVTSVCAVVDGIIRSSFSRTRQDEPLIYSLNNGKLTRLFGLEWRKAGIEAVIAKTSKSKYDGRFNALHALVAAKSNRYEAERLVHYWMAMNGLYNYAASLGNAILPKTSKGSNCLTGDKTNYVFLGRCYGHEPCAPSPAVQLPGSHKYPIKWKADSVLKRIPPENINDFCFACIAEDRENEHVKKLLDNLRTEEFDYSSQSIFSIMVLLVPYMHRCETFHGEKSLPTFCYRDDGELKALHVINEILDSFLTAELAKWLNEEPESVNWKNKLIEKAAANPAYHKGGKGK